MIFRSARHTNQLNTIKEFYTDILGLDFLGEFVSHHNYNGIFLGKKESDWHLEFTASNNETTHIFDEDDCLVFYPSTQEEYDAVLKKIEVNKIERKIPKNPYWSGVGVMISDPDGYGVVVSPQKIEK